MSSPRVIIIEARSRHSASRHCFIVSCSKHIMGPFHQKWLEVSWAPACHSIPSSHQQHSATVDKRNTSKKYFGSPKKSSPPRANFCYLEIKQKKTKNRCKSLGSYKSTAPQRFTRDWRLPNVYKRWRVSSSTTLAVCCKSVVSYTSIFV